jgi:hypothetical protein
MFEDIPFAFVAFVNDTHPYPALMNITLESHRLFSKVPFILYLAGDAKPEWFPSRPNLHIIQIPKTVEFYSVFTFKPYILKDVISKGLRAGYYTEADDILTPNCDSIQDYLDQVSVYPLSPIHPNGTSFPIPQEYMELIGASEQTQPYCHTHGILFKDSCEVFMEEWLQKTQRVSGLNWDESVLNCLLWKYDCTDYYLPILYRQFHDYLEGVTPTPTYGAYKDPPISIHGSKDLQEALAILGRLIEEAKR